MDLTSLPAAPPFALRARLLTPLDATGGVDGARLVRHAQGLLAFGVDGVAPFGTTGEGQSFTVAERIAGTDALLEAGIPGRQVVAATGCAALPDTVTLTRHGVQSGCAACLVLPPFFWKDATDDGLFTWYARLIDAVGDVRLRVYLYHIPQVSGVPLSVDLIARLAAAFPGIVAGVKDSAGDWHNTSALLVRVPQLAIMVGHEPDLPKLMPARSAASPTSIRISCARCFRPASRPPTNSASRPCSTSRSGSRCCRPSRPSSPNVPETRDGSRCARRWFLWMSRRAGNCSRHCVPPTCPRPGYDGRRDGDKGSLSPADSPGPVI